MVKGGHDFCSSLYIVYIAPCALHESHFTAPVSQPAIYLIDDQFVFWLLMNDRQCLPIT